MFITACTVIFSPLQFLCILLLGEKFVQVQTTAKAPRSQPVSQTGASSSRGMAGGSVSLPERPSGLRRMCLNPHPSVPITLNLPLLTPKSKSCCRQLAVPEALLPAEALKTLPLPSSCTSAAPRVTTTVVPSCLGQLKNSEGTSLVVQWLRLRLPLQGLQVQSLVGKLRSHMLCSQKIRT